jgi:hypothetical protein
VSSHSSSEGELTKNMAKTQLNRPIQLQPTSESGVESGQKLRELNNSAETQNPVSEEANK